MNDDIWYCSECGVKEGEFHVPNCMNEICPICRIPFGYNTCKHNIEKLKKEGQIGRVPYLYLPNICPRCGKVNPTMFHVPDAEWNAVIPLFLQKEVICLRCYELIRTWRDKAEEEKKEKIRRIREAFES